MKKILLISSAVLGLMTANVLANDVPEFKVVIKDHKFSPVNLDIPAGKKVKLIVDNQDKTAEEFESHDLKKEKVVGGNKKITLFVGPLEVGTYKYFGEFNPKTAQGTITAK